MSMLPGILLGIILFGQTASAIALTISNVSHAPSYVASQNDKVVTVRFKLDEPASVKLKIYDKEDKLIKTITGPAIHEAGDSELQWNIDDANGKRVVPEAYHYTLEANSQGQSVTHDLTDITGYEQITATNIQWNKSKGEIKYIMPKYARASLRVGIAEGGPLLATLLDWVPRPYGENTETWDGMDASDTVDISKLDKSEIYIDAYTLSKNTIIVGRSTGQTISAKAADSSAGRERRMSASKINRSVLDVKQATQPDYKLKIILKGELLDETAKVSTVKGKLAVKLSVPELDKERMSKDRFEPIMFIDNVYFSEVETGFFPVTWHLDTSTLENGEHLITVNIRGYNGQYAAASRRIKVEN